MSGSSRGGASTSGASRGGASRGGRAFGILRVASRGGGRQVVATGLFALAALAAAPAPGQGGATSPASGAGPATADAAAPGDASRLLDRVIAVVNQEAITQSELQSRVAVIQRQLAQQRQAPPSQPVLERQVLEQLILDRVQLQYAKESGVRPSEAEIDRAIADVAQRNSVSLQGMRDQLSAQGIGFAAYRDQIASEITTLRLRDREARSKVTIAEAEVDAYLQKQGALGSAEYEVGHILLKLASDADAATVARRVALAEDLARRARGPADFADLAREHSESPEGLQGGSLGWRVADRLPQLFVDTITPLAPGQVAAPVRSPAGLHVLKLLGKRSGAPAEGAQLEQTRARHILLPVTGQADAGDAMRRLVEFRRRIEGGESFESLARQFSVDGSAAAGGDLGWLYPGDTVPEFERAMNALAPGAISQPLRTQFGVHLIQVIERRKDENTPERLRASARQAIREQKADEAFDQWLREQRERAYVEYRLDQG